MVIKQLREKEQLTQAELASVLEVSQQTIAKWECGLAAPRTALLPKIADLLHCSIDDLFGRESADASQGTIKSIPTGCC